MRQQTGEITEYRGERVQKNITSLKPLLFLALYILFATFCLLSHLYSFSNYFLPCFCLFQSVFSYFLLFSTHSLPYSLYFFHHPFIFFLQPTFLVSLTLRGDTVIFLLLCPTMAVPMCAQSRREGLIHYLHYKSLTSR